MHMNPVVSHVTIHHCVGSHLNTSSVFSSPSPGGTRCPLPRNPLGASSPCCRGLPSSSQHSRGAFACLLLWHGNLHTTIGCLTCVQGQVLKSTSWQKLFQPCMRLPQAPTREGGVEADTCALCQRINEQTEAQTCRNREFQARPSAELCICYATHLPLPNALRAVWMCPDWVCGPQAIIQQTQQQTLATISQQDVQADHQQQHGHRPVRCWTPSP